MADFNDVPLGQAGTGAAFILPGSQAAAGFLSDLDRNRQIEAQNALTKQKYAQQLANSYRENQLKIKGGINWNPEIQQRAKAITDMGNQLFQAGVNPYSYDHSDPRVSQQVDTFNLQRQQLMQDVDTRDAYQKQLDEDDKQLALHGPGAFEPEYLQQRQQFLNTPLSKISQTNAQLPTLTRAFNANEFYNKLKPTPIERKFTDKNNIEHTIQIPDEASHRQTVLASIQSDPSALRAYQRTVGLPLDQVATTTNFDKEKDFNTDYFKNTPEGQKELVDNGITSVTSDKFKKFVDDQTQQSIDAKKRGDAFIQNGVDKLNGDVKRINNSKYNDDYERMQLAYRTANRADDEFAYRKAKDAKADEKKATSGEVVLGNQNSTVPVLKAFQMPQYKEDKKGNKIKVDAGYQPETGASLFSSNFDNERVTVTPSRYVDLSKGTAVKNTEPFNMDVGTVKMVPVFKGTSGATDGAEISLRQLQDIVSGKKKDVGLKNIEFVPMAYGQRPTTKNGKTVYQGIAIPYDAIKGNKKIPTQNFDKTIDQFHQLLASPEFNSLDNQQKLEFLQKTFNIQ